MRQSFDDELMMNIKAHTPVIHVISSDCHYIESKIMDAAESLQRRVFIWNKSGGIVEAGKKPSRFDPPPSSQKEIKQDDSHKMLLSEFMKEIESHGESRYGKSNSELPHGDAESILDWFMSDKHKNIILVMEELQFIENGIIHNWNLIGGVKRISESPKEDKNLILIQSEQKIPREIVHDVSVIECLYPDKNAVREVFVEVINEFDLSDDKYDDCPELIGAVSGLTLKEVRRAFSKAVAAYGKLTKEEISAIVGVKKQFINSEGLLQYYESDKTLKDLGGLDNLKEWLSLRKPLQEQSAKEYGLKDPKGILLVGPPGTGKSLGAEIVANILGWPLVKFDVSRVFDQWVGLSEQNMRKALACAESMAPCVLWIDEVDKGFAGNSHKNNGDNCSTARVFGIFVNWLQERKSPVFVVATANRLNNIPPEFSRNGRFDETFFIDLPAKNERKEIIGIHLKNFNHDKFSCSDMDMLADISCGYSGAELEDIMHDAALHSYLDKRALRADDVKKAIKSGKPLSVRRRNEIIECRAAANEMSRPASSEKSDVDALYEKEQMNIYVQNEWKKCYQ